jgi:GntR family transcriptional regulator
MTVCPDSMIEDAAVRPEFPLRAIDHRSPVPLYFQLERMIEQEIVEGRLEAGARLPSEPELGQLLDVSRSVVRQALGRLEQQGLITRRKGDGTYVARVRPRSWLLQSSQGFFEDEVDRLGVRVTSKVLRAAVEPLPPWAAAALGLEEDAVGVTLERLRSVEGLVALYVVNHLLPDVAETVLDESRPDASLYRRLKERHDLDVAGGRRVLEAVPAGEKLGALLEVRPDFPLVFIESVSWDSRLRPFDCYRTWLRTDRMKIDVEVASPVFGSALAPELEALAGGTGGRPRDDERGGL